MNKILSFIAFVVLTSFAAAAPKVTITKPVSVNGGVLRTISGTTWAMVCAACTGTAGTSDFQPNTTCQVSGTLKCSGTNTVVAIIADDQTVDFAADEVMKIIAWAEYGTWSNVNQKNEWDRAVGEITAHENRHYDFSVGWLTKSRAETYVTAFTDKTGNVVPEAGIQEEFNRILLEFQSPSSGLATTMNTDERKDDNVDIKDPPGQSKDRPDPSVK